MQRNRCLWIMPMLYCVVVTFALMIRQQQQQQQQHLPNRHKVISATIQSNHLAHALTKSVVLTLPLSTKISLYKFHHHYHHHCWPRNSHIKSNILLLPLKCYCLPFCTSKRSVAFLYWLVQNHSQTHSMRATATALRWRFFTRCMTSTIRYHFVQQIQVTQILMMYFQRHLYNRLRFWTRQSLQFKVQLLTANQTEINVLLRTFQGDD